MSSRDHLAAPKLRTIHAVAQSLAIGPIYSAAVLGGVIASIAGGVSPAVLVIALPGVLSLAWVVSQYARRFAGAGAMYEYLSNSLGRRAGVAGSMGHAFALMFLGPAFVIPVGLLFQTFATEHLGFDPGWWSGGLAAMFLVLIFQLIGIGLSVRVQIALTALSAMPILILCAVVIAEGGASGNTLEVFNPGASFAGDVFRTILFVLTLFIGFELAASLGEETAEPHRAIPRALIGTVLASGIWFILTFYVGTIGFGPSKAGVLWGGQANGLATLARHYVGAADATAIEIAVFLDAIAVWLAMANSLVRIEFALSRDHLLWKGFQHTNKAGVPIYGVVSWVVVTIGIVIATAIATIERLEMLTILLTAASLVVLVVYLAVVIGSLKFIEFGWKWLIVLAAGAVPVLGIYGSVNPFPEGALQWGVWIAIIGAASALLWTAYVCVTRPDAIAKAGARGLDVPETPVKLEPAPAEAPL